MFLRVIWLLLLVGGLSACSPPPYTNLDNNELKSLLAKGVPIYDVRRPDEWRQTGVLEGSQRLTFVDDNGRLMPEFFSRFTQAVGKNDPVILICRTGSRTDVLARHLIEKLGYTQVYNVRDGITGWIRAGLPVTRN